MKNNGFGIIAVLVGATILAIASFGIQTMIKTSHSQILAQEFLQDLIGLRTYLNAVMDCTETFSTLNDCNNSVIELRDRNGVVLSSFSGRWSIQGRCETKGGYQVINIEKRGWLMGGADFPNRMDPRSVASIEWSPLNQSGGRNETSTFCSRPVPSPTPNVPCPQGQFCPQFTQNWALVVAPIVCQPYDITTENDECTALSPPTLGQRVDRVQCVGEPKCPTGFRPVSGGANCVVPCTDDGCKGGGVVMQSFPSSPDANRPFGAWYTRCCSYTDQNTPEINEGKAFAICVKLDFSY